MVDNSGRIVRGKLWFDDGFTMIPNSMVRNPRLSYGARGLLGVLISHDVGFELTIASLSAGSTQGLDAVRSLVNELEREGYLKRYQKRERGRIVGVQWHILDPLAPVDNLADLQLDLGGSIPVKSARKSRSAPERDFPTPVKPTTDEPHAANPTTKEDHLQEEETKTPEATTEQARAKCAESPTGAHQWEPSGWCYWGEHRRLEAVPHG